MPTFIKIPPLSSAEISRHAN